MDDFGWSDFSKRNPDQLQEPETSEQRPGTSDQQPAASNEYP
jgi:hypothetical protein